MRVLAPTLYDGYVHMPNPSEEWETQLRGFIENYEFPPPPMLLVALQNRELQSLIFTPFSAFLFTILTFFVNTHFL